MAAGDNYSVQEGRTLTVSGPGVLGNDSDPDGDAILADQFTQGTNGSVTLAADGSFSYTPNAGFSGIDTFTYRIFDGAAYSAYATVTIEVVEGTPLATADSYSVQQGQTLIVAVPGLLANDSDPNGDPVVAELLTQAANGSVTLASDGSFTYTPNAGYAGTDSFTYRISDGFGGTDEAVVTINVTSTNSAPVIAPIGAVPAEEGDVVVIDIDATDADGDGITFELVDAPAGATIDPTTGLFTWAATDGDANYGVTVRANDGKGGSSEATFAVNVANVPPAIGLVGSDTAVLGTPYTLTVGAGDPGDDTVTQWEIDWGDGNVQIVSAGDTLTLQHTYTSGTGVFDISVAATDEDGTWDAAEGLTVNVVPAQFRVTAFTPTASGFSVRFNQEIDPSVLNLYQGAGSDPLRTGDADVRVLVGTTPVRGSLVMDADGRGFAFVKTGGTLTAGTYNVTIASRANGLIDSLGRLLDGDANGTAGGAYTTSFVVGAIPATTPVLSLPDFIRGPGQDVRVPNNGAAGVALPLTLSNANGVQRVTFLLNYDARLLAISTIEAMPGGPAATVSVTGVPGALRVTIEFAAPLSGAAARAIANIRATVPATAPYGGQHRLDIAEVQATLTGSGAVAGIDDDAVHAVGYLGDTDGNRSYGAKDPFLLQNVVAARESGFGAWALTDPTVVGDIVAAAGLNVLDVLRLQQHVIALAHNPSVGLPEFPPIVPLGSLSALALSTLPAPAEQPLAPPMELAGTKVNWQGRFAPDETTPNVAATGVVVAGTSVDWMNSPWARDLTDRLATSHAQAESASKSVLPGRELLRTLTRAFARR